MPYIKPNQRQIYDEDIQRLINKLYAKWKGFGDISGDFNYIISSLFVGYLNQVKVRYEWLNTFIGVLECVKLEFYRRLAGPYENQKIEENGDIYYE